MAYRIDDDLEFLKDCASEDLDALIAILTRDSGGSLRLTEEITANERYIASAPDHSKYWDLIAAEIQYFGANSLATMVRGGSGVLYRNVLADVCQRMDVIYSAEVPVEIIEKDLLIRIFSDSMESLTPEQLQAVVKELDLETTSFTAQAVVLALQTVVKRGGFMAYKMALIVANSVAKVVLGRGLSLAANAGLTRLLGMASGPIGWTFTGLWTIYDLSGPAFRVTLPCVLQVAFLRARPKA